MNLANHQFGGIQIDYIFCQEMRFSLLLASLGGPEGKVKRKMPIII